jgi:hypothetical protein
MAERGFYFFALSRANFATPLDAGTDWVSGVLDGLLYSAGTGEVFGLCFAFHSR